jgi:hypothetical protein
MDGALCPGLSLGMMTKIALCVSGFEDAKRAYREIHILHHLRHENIIQLHDVVSTTITGHIRPDSTISEQSKIDQESMLFIQKAHSRKMRGLPRNLGEY